VSDAKPPTPEVISALLREAGFEEATDTARGFKVTPSCPGDAVVTVAYWEAAGDIPNWTWRVMQFGLMTNALLECGYSVRHGAFNDGHESHIVVNLPDYKPDPRRSAWQHSE
jgi:hypothetical protein